MSAAKKIAKLNPWCHTDVKEWLLQPDQVALYVADIASSVSAAKGCDAADLSILVVGVGFSSNAHALVCDKGFRSVVVTDIEAESIAFQEALFSGSPRKPAILEDDLLDSKLDRGKFDIIVDSSCTDVFIRQHVGQAAFSAIGDLLAPGGVVLCISMFHKPWKRLAAPATWRSFPRRPSSPFLVQKPR